jgi:hypothetical protein
MTARPEIAKKLRELSNPELGQLWHATHQAGAMGALAYVENELIRRAREIARRRADRKGGPLAHGSTNVL